MAVTRHAEPAEVIDMVRQTPTGAQARRDDQLAGEHDWREASWLPAPNQTTNHPSGPDGARCPQHRPTPAARRGMAVQTTTATNCYGPACPPLSATDLLRAGQGDPTAWEEIVRRYSSLVFARVRSFRLQEADALDAVQMTWLRLAENAHRVHHPEHLGGWLATTASRECLRILRQAKHTEIPTDAVTDNVADPSIGPEQHAIDADTAQALRNLVAELPPRRQTLVRALFADNTQPYAEIARTTGIPPGSIGPTRARTLEQLRQALAAHGLAPGD